MLKIHPNNHLAHNNKNGAWMRHAILQCQPILLLMQARNCLIRMEVEQIDSYWFGMDSPIPTIYMTQ